MRALVTTLSLLLLAACLLISCNVERVDPVVHGPYTNPVSARLTAESRARELGGFVYFMTCCDSMAPLIRDGDYVVVVPRTLSDELTGHVVAYRPAWYGGNVIVHRLVGKIGNGYLAEGDARTDNKGRPVKPEVKEPVTGVTFVGEVVEIYSVRL